MKIMINENRLQICIRLERTVPYAFPRTGRANVRWKITGVLSSFFLLEQLFHNISQNITLMRPKKRKVWDGTPVWCFACRWRGYRNRWANEWYRRVVTYQSAFFSFCIIQCVLLEFKELCNIYCFFIWFVGKVCEISVTCGEVVAYF